jgi:hypothetical protein
MICALSENSGAETATQGDKVITNTSAIVAAEDKNPHSLPDTWRRRLTVFRAKFFNALASFQKEGEFNRQPGSARSPRLCQIRRSVDALNSGLALDKTGARRIVDSRRERIQFQSYEDDRHFASAHQHSSTQESG